MTGGAAREGMAAITWRDKALLWNYLTGWIVYKNWGSDGVLFFRGLVVKASAKSDWSLDEFDELMLAMTWLNFEVLLALWFLRGQHYLWINA
jgi:hypothetical protein